MSAHETNQTSTAPGGFRPYRVVVGIDFDQTSEYALREAYALAECRTGVELHVVHAVKNPVRPSVRPGTRVSALNAALEQTPPRVAAFVTEMRGMIPGAEKHRVAIHVRVGGAAEAVHQAAVDLDADLIIVGTHGRTGLDRIAAGSVATALVRDARCPVLVARPRRFEGLPKSAEPEAPCPVCLKVREDSSGQTMWCEFHSRPQVRVHTYGSGSGIGGHDPSIVPTGLGV